MHAELRVCTCVMVVTCVSPPSAPRHCQPGVGGGGLLARPLHAALLYGNIALAKHLVAKGAVLHPDEPPGALWVLGACCALHNHSHALAGVRFLLEHGVGELDTPDDEVWPSLSYPCLVFWRLGCE